MKKEVFKGFKKGVLAMMMFLAAVVLTSSSVTSRNIEDYEKVVCGQCNGDEVVDCTKCDNGKLNCPTCRTVSGKKRFDAYCGKCEDTGEVFCSKCSGSGKVKCAGPDGCKGLGYRIIKR